MASALRRRVLITGAGGSIGKSLAAGLQETYDLRLHYRTVPTGIRDTEAVAA